MRIFILGLVLLMASCENKKESTTTTGTDTTITNPAITDGKNVDEPKPVESVPDPEVPTSGQCYIQTSGRDTTLLQLDRQGNLITGRMLFDNYQKDGSHGTVKGTAKGNIIELWYDFESEGMRSKRQLFFKEDGDQLLWGKGVQAVSNDSTYYKDPAVNTYSAHLFMRKINCGDIDFN